jgi:exodeoxyribonuclease III
MKIITYNVNGIRSAVQKGFLEWLSLAAPDIICIQETKAQPDQIPVLELAALGYQSFIHSAVKRGYSGVAIFTKITPDHVEYGLGIEKYDFEGRVICADFGDISVMSVYHPSGTTGEVRQAFKMQWLSDFSNYIQQIRQTRPNLILSGDYNICHRPIDIHDPVGNARSSGFLPEEREWMTGFLQNGFIDTFRHLNPDPHNYTWWSFRMNARERNLGWRIDYNMVTASLEKKIRRAYILPQAKHSDHCPAVLEIDI